MTTPPTPGPGAQIPSTADIAAHYANRLAVETDCADVHDALAADPTAFVLIDTRSAEAFAEGHLPHAVSLPHREITAERLQAFGEDAQFVTYCWGPHCNAATKGAAAIAALGWRVREMLGGVWGWQMDGHDLVTPDATSG